MLTLNAFALPSAASASLALACGALVVLRERFSRNGWRHLIFAVSVFAWQLCMAGLLLSQSETTARAWVFAAAATAVFLPAALFHFTSSLSRESHARLDPAAWLWVGSGCFLVTLVATDEFVVGLARYRWGLYPAYGPLGLVFIAFTFVAILLCYRMIALVMRNNPVDGVVWRRARLLLVALGCEALGALDFLPAVGVNVFPAGGLFVSLGLVLNIYTTWRYRLVEITPALAAQQFMDTMTDGVLVLDRDGMVRLVNPAACEILGLASAQLLHAFPPRPVVRLIMGETEDGRFPSGPCRMRECEYQRPSIGTRTLSVSVSMIYDGGDVPLAAVAILHDVTAARAAQEQIHRLAYYDPLTGLPNRLLLKERFGHVISWAERARAHAAVLFLDLDRFKQINDTLGHEAGDLLLKAVTDRITTCVRESDLVMRRTEGGQPSTLARLGGDEFVLLLSPIERGEDAQGVASRIIQILSDPIRLHSGHEVVTGVSIGIALYPADGDDAQTLMRKADLAMYHAKESGRNNARFYDDVLNTAVAQRASTETSLRRALVGHEFLLRYQPVVATLTGAVVGIETQVFWNHPSRGLLPAREFADAAQETGVALSLDDWVVRTACAQMHAWCSGGVPASTAVLVSIGALTLVRGNLVETVREALAQSPIDPARLWLCVPPVEARAAASHVPAVLQAVASLGVQIVIDDFGTGRISVADVLARPVHMVRMEGEYLRRIPEDAEAVKAVRALLGFVQGFGMKAIACGVSDPRALPVLRDAGCTHCVGDVHAPAVPAEEVPTLLAQLELAPRF
ncbi:MAG: EAL domain-containing protein [Betaproteobacteria bacterium]|nr:EAL domain-containing protein [Betaproteobacteria bacterium]